MKLGYIHNSREEQTRVLQVLKMTSESVALDELGIGRIRDAFADRNEFALQIDYEQEPPFFEISPTHQVASWLLDQRAPKVKRPQIKRME